MSISRRSLTLAIGAMVALSPARFATLAQAAELDRDFSTNSYRNAFSSRAVFDSAAAIGKVILKQRHVQSNLVSVSALLNKSLCQSSSEFHTTTSDSKDALAIRKYLANSVARDFAEGSIIDVDGWLLAKTEADLCVLAALLKDHRLA